MPVLQALLRNTSHPSSSSSSISSSSWISFNESWHDLETAESGTMDVTQQPLPKSTTDFRAATFYCALIMLTLCIVGFLGNAISLWVFTRRQMRTSPINVLLAALSGVDMAVLITAVPVFVVPSLNTFLYDIDKTDLYKILLSGFYQALMITQTCSVWIFVLISMERYVAVCSPFDARQRLTEKKAQTAVLIILVFAIAYNTPRFFEYKSDPIRGYVQWLRADSYYFAIYFTTLYLLTHFLGPFLVITILNAIIFKAIRRARYERTQMSNSRSSEKKTRQKHQTTRMVVVVTIMFGFCNVLPFVLNAWEALDSTMYSEHRLAAYLTLDIANGLIVLNSSSTCIIYFVYCQKYRSIIVTRLLSFCRLRRRHGARQQPSGGGSSPSPLPENSENERQTTSQQDYRVVRLSLTPAGNSIVSTYGSYYSGGSAD